VKVGSKPVHRRGRIYAQAERVAVLTLEADSGEEECLLAWLRRAVTEDGPEMERLVALYQPTESNRKKVEL
jgi:hypothetical protein